MLERRGGPPTASSGEELGVGGASSRRGQPAA